MHVFTPTYCTNTYIQLVLILWHVCRFLPALLIICVCSNLGVECKPVWENPSIIFKITCIFYCPCGCGILLDGSCVGPCSYCMMPQIRNISAFNTKKDCLINVSRQFQSILREIFHLFTLKRKIKTS